MENLIKIELTEFDAKLFLQFQKRYAFVKLMESLGIFDVTTGSVTVHFDSKGQIGAVEVNKKYVYNNT